MSHLTPAENALFQRLLVLKKSKSGASAIINANEIATLVSFAGRYIDMARNSQPLLITSEST